jgi:manganese/zinc/iron transport system substrate-binding protein
VPAVFVETSVPDRSVRAICEGAAAKGHRVTTGGRLYSDALGEPGSGAETLAGALTANVNVICEALGGDVATEDAEPPQATSTEQSTDPS